MPQIFPLTNYGNRMIEIAQPDGTAYRMRTYYSEGQINAWFFDMWDSQMRPLVKGIPVVVGSANLLAAYSGKFPKGSKLIAALTEGDESSPDALGSGLDLVWYGADEKSPFVVGDPMLSAATTDFQTTAPTYGDHNTLSNRDLPNQHPVKAIQGLGEILADKASNAQLAQKLGDSPQDGLVYGRRNGAWVPTGAGGGGDSSAYFFVDGNSLILRHTVLT